MFPRLAPPVALEEEVLAFWDAERIFERTLAQGEGKPPFVFYEGPPTANGTPHNGHVLTRVIKDAFPRYRTMRGYHVARKAGWDTHGLPVEVEVEKSLGIHGREAIEAYGLEAFAHQCIQSVFKYTREWEQLTRQIGFWVDLEQAYVTYHREYVESVWWALSRLFEKGLLYQGHKVVWWWPQGGTTLSAAEVGLGYKQVTDPAVTVRFRDAEDPSVSYLAWTTTPWTLPSNVALAVGANVTYAYCDDPAGGEVVVAEALAASYGLEPKRTVQGSELVGRRYVPLYDFGAPQGGDAFVIVVGEHVTTTAGSGIVHTAPAFGEDDMLVAQRQGLGMLQWVEPSGKFAAHTGFLAGKFCKDADADIIRDLKERGLLFKRDQILHDYPFCWRADEDPLIQYARPAWFIRTTARVDQALVNNGAVRWLPEHIQEGRFGDFLRNNVDWALSRERFWGTPLNIWRCEACDHHVAPESTAAIEALNPAAFQDDVDRDLQVHRPWVDGIVLPCPKCSGTMRRVPEVIDCWFDSGCMPFAQWGFPHANVDTFRASFPADFISEAVDQTRGWFYSLLMISTLLFDDETCRAYDLAPVGFPRPYKNCIVLGHVTDMDGRKESKSKGNYTSPNLVLRGVAELDVLPDASLARGEVGMKRDQVRSLDQGDDERVGVSAVGGERQRFKIVAADVKPKDTIHLNPADLAALGIPVGGGRGEFALESEAPGADAFRWLFCASNPPWSNTRLSIRAVRDGQREFLLRLRNVYQFFTIYANIAAEAGQFDPATGTAPPVAQRAELDRWVLHRLHETVRDVTACMDDYLLYDASRKLLTFVDDLSNWYVRRSRARFWGEGDDLVCALWTLYEVLVTTAKLIAPFVPFTAEGLYRALVGPLGDAAAPSVHMAAWPDVDAALLDSRLGADMALIRELASLGLSARSDARLKVRQPLAEATVVLADHARGDVVAAHADILEDELNVRRIRLADDATVFVDYQVKPDFKKLGPKLGKDVKIVAAALAAADGAAVKAGLDAGGYAVPVGDTTFTVTAEDVVLRVDKKEGFEAASSPIAVVALTTELTDALVAEGLVRELTSRVQALRRDLDLGYTQRIALRFSGEPALLDALDRYGAYLQRETLCTDLATTRLDTDGGGWVERTWDVEGHAITAALLPR